MKIETVEQIEEKNGKSAWTHNLRMLIEIDKATTLEEKIMLSARMMSTVGIDCPF